MGSLGMGYWYRRFVAADVALSEDLGVAAEQLYVEESCPPPQLLHPTFPYILDICNHTKDIY